VNGGVGGSPTNDELPSYIFMSVPLKTISM